MSVTQLYKKVIGKPAEFTLPLAGADIVRSLFEQRMTTVQAVLDDPEADSVLSRADLTALAFEHLMLAKMMQRMRSVRHA